MARAIIKQWQVTEVWETKTWKAKRDGGGIWQSRQTQPKCLGGGGMFHCPLQLYQTAPNSNAYNSLSVLSCCSGSQKSGEVLTELKLRVWVGCVHVTTSSIWRLLEAACISGLWAFFCLRSRQCRGEPFSGCITSTSSSHLTDFRSLFCHLT